MNLQIPEIRLNILFYFPFNFQKLKMLFARILHNKLYSISLAYPDICISKIRPHNKYFFLCHKIDFANCISHFWLVENVEYSITQPERMLSIPCTYSFNRLMFGVIKTVTILKVI